MIPWLSHCGDELFTAYDPPSTLKPATALAPPPVPYSDPKTHPWASPTLNLEAGQIFGVKTSVPVPANTPTLDQPKATMTTASKPPKQKDPDHGPHPNDPGAQEGLSPQLQSGKIVANSDPKGSNDPHQGSDPLQGGGSDPTWDSVDKGFSGQVHKSQGSDQNTDSTLQDDPKKTFEVDPANDFTESQTKTINKQVVQLLSHGISIAGTTLTKGASPIIVSGTPIYFGPSALIIGKSTAPLAPEVPTHMTTTIGSQAIIAASDVVAIAGDTPSAGASDTTVDGTVLSLDTASHFLVASKTTISLTSKPSQIITTHIPGHTYHHRRTERSHRRRNEPSAPESHSLISLNTATQIILGPKTLAFESPHHQTPPHYENQNQTPYRRT